MTMKQYAYIKPDGRVHSTTAGSQPPAVREGLEIVEMEPGSPPPGRNTRYVDGQFVEQVILTP